MLPTIPIHGGMRSMEHHLSMLMRQVPLDSSKRSNMIVATVYNIFTGFIALAMLFAVRH